MGPESRRAASDNPQEAARHAERARQELTSLREVGIRLGVALGRIHEWGDLDPSYARGDLEEAAERACAVAEDVAGMAEQASTLASLEAYTKVSGNAAAVVALLAESMRALLRAAEEEATSSEALP